MIHFACPKCHKPLKVDNALSGRRVRCPRCRAISEVSKSIGALIPVELRTEAMNPLQTPEPETVYAEPYDLEDPNDGDADSFSDDLVGGDQKAKRQRTTLMVLSVMAGLMIVGVPVLILLINAASDKKPNVAQQLEKTQELERKASAPELARREELVDAWPARAEDNIGTNSRSAIPPPLEVEENPARKPSTSEPMPAPVEPAEPSRSQETPAQDRLEQQRIQKRVSELVRRLTDPMSTRMSAVKELGVLGPKAKSARRALCKALLPPAAPLTQRQKSQNDSFRLAVKDALQEIDPVLHDLVRTIIFVTNPNDVTHAILELENLKGEGNAATPVLIAYRQACHGGVPVLRALAAVAVNEDSTSDVFVACILADKHDSCREFACRTLPKLARAKKKALTPLISRLQDPSPNVRAAAAWALGEIGDHGSNVTNALKKASTDASMEVIVAAEQALSKLKQSK